MTDVASSVIEKRQAKYWGGCRLIVVGIMGEIQHPHDMRLRHSTVWRARAEMTLEVNWYKLAAWFIHAVCWERI